MFKFVINHNIFYVGNEVVYFVLDSFEWIFFNPFKTLVSLKNIFMQASLQLR